jgi:hypothetical protein
MEWYNPPVFPQYKWVCFQTARFTDLTESPFGSDCLGHNLPMSTPLLPVRCGPQPLHQREGFSATKRQ